MTIEQQRDKIFSSFEILLPGTEDEFLTRITPFYKYYEPILNSMLGELCNKGAGSKNESFVNYNVISHWAMRKLEYSFILDHVFEKLGPRDNILDLGGGVTPFINVFSGAERQCISVDNSPLDVMFMHKHNERIYGRKCIFHCVDMTDLIYADNIFDYVISVSVFEHLNSVEHIKKAIDEAFRVLKPGGKLVATWAFLHDPVETDLSADNFQTVVSQVLVPFSKEINPNIALPSEEDITSIWKKYWFPSCKYDLDNVPKWTAFGFCLIKEGEKDFSFEESTIRYRDGIEGICFDNEPLYLLKKTERVSVKIQYVILNNAFTRTIARKVKKILRRVLTFCR